METDKRKSPRGSKKPPQSTMNLAEVVSGNIKEEDSDAGSDFESPRVSKGQVPNISVITASAVKEEVEKENEVSSGMSSESSNFDTSDDVDDYIENDGSPND